MARNFSVAILLLHLGLGLFADVLMSPAEVNETLKKLTRLKQQIEAGSQEERGEALFELASESDALAKLINEEIASHGMQEKQLIDLTLERTRQLGISISYHSNKRKFLYDGRAFELYVQGYKKGAHAARAGFKLLERDFFRSTGTEIGELLAGIQAIRKFLFEYPKFERNSEVSLFLALDYRDLYRLYRDKKDRRNQTKYEKLTQQQFQEVTRSYPKSEEAGIARQLLDNFRAEIAAVSNSG